MSNTFKKLFSKGDRIKILREDRDHLNAPKGKDYNQATVLSSRRCTSYGIEEEVVTIMMNYGSKSGFLVIDGKVQGHAKRVVKI